ncbi:hypothetical protein JMJ35_000887 [Cladonia borealis]|uniref:YCII-related domain-containing protein n=1 Tax=Cladonia borealis TaxID=184061 RepID=A0AA39V7G0_9LECA|nr:hypothetical protein JMJ35_000887 [Cladonia borealis]
MTQQYDWLVQVPDKPNALQTRMSNLASHLSYNKPHIEAGKLVFTGPTLSSQPKSADEVPAMTGTVTLFKAETEDEVWEMVKGNPFAEVGVWDLEKATVTPFRCAVRKAL